MMEGERRELILNGLSPAVSTLSQSIPCTSSKKIKMLDAWKKNKFYSKCKSIIKQTKTRIEMLRKKRNAMQKYLKNDIADLLKSGLDVNAYERTEGLLLELNLLCCYDLLDQYCDHIFTHLESIIKQRECPEDCRGPVASLMFAAARLADLPELRQLRTLFSERYENSLDCSVSIELVEKLKQVPHTKATKLQLMQDIAAEYGVAWNSKALQQKLSESEQDLQRGKEHTDEASNHKELEAAVSSHENVRHHHTKSRVSTTNEEHTELRAQVAREEYNGDDDAVEKTKPKPKSVRRNSSKVEETQIENHDIKIANGEVSRHSKPNGPSGRTASLPVELEQISPEELIKGHVRANSFQPDMFGSNVHTHHKLPNYDEVIARLADLSRKPKE